MKVWFLDVVHDFVASCDDNGWPEDQVSLVGEFVKFAITYVRS